MERTAGDPAIKRVDFVRGVVRRDFAVVRERYGWAMAAAKRWVATVMSA